MIGVIDYTRKAGKSYYSKATEALSGDPFDCNPEGFYSFLQRIRSKALDYGWSDHITGVLMIPNDFGARGGPMTSILDGYG